ncbi:hypothetical protein PR048_003153 [Dryococelus australis]|uniref:Uncharacterized protein n=1 Tax=Dryococelus australis TaxID=614101 RepID=A0ABQ9IPH5_9NEOP|nr:hypothetical protein PR048_003153 [Dryococelus australis]
MSPLKEAPRGTCVTERGTEAQRDTEQVAQRARTWKESTMDCSKEPPQYTTEVTSGNYYKPESGWLDRGALTNGKCEEEEEEDKEKEEEEKEKEEAKEEEEKYKEEEEEEQQSRWLSAVLTGSMSRTHVICGLGLPTAVHSSTALWPISTTLVVGACVMCGKPLGNLSAATTTSRPPRSCQVLHAARHASFDQLFPFLWASGLTLAEFPRPSLQRPCEKTRYDRRRNEHAPVASARSFVPQPAPHIHKGLARTINQWLISGELLGNEAKGGDEGVGGNRKPQGRCTLRSHDVTHLERYSALCACLCRPYWLHTSAHGSRKMDEVHESLKIPCLVRTATVFAQIPSQGVLSRGLKSLHPKESVVGNCCAELYGGLQQEMNQANSAIEDIHYLSVHYYYRLFTSQDSNSPPCLQVGENLSRHPHPSRQKLSTVKWSGERWPALSIEVLRADEASQQSPAVISETTGNPHQDDRTGNRARVLPNGSPVVPVTPPHSITITDIHLKHSTSPEFSRDLRALPCKIGTLLVCYHTPLSFHTTNTSSAVISYPLLTSVLVADVPRCTRLYLITTIQPDGSTKTPNPTALRRGGGMVAERLACCLLPRRTEFNPRPGHRIFACGNSAGRCRWSAGSLGNLTFPPPLHSGAAAYLPCITLIGSQDLAVESSSNFFTHLTPAAVCSRPIAEKFLQMTRCVGHPPKSSASPAWGGGRDTSQVGWQSFWAARRRTSERVCLGGRVEVVHLPQCRTAQREGERDMERERGGERYGERETRDITPPPSPNPISRHRPLSVRRARNTACCKNGERGVGV